MRTLVIAIVLLVVAAAAIALLLAERPVSHPREASDPADLETIDTTKIQYERLGNILVDRDTSFQQKQRALQILAQHDTQEGLQGLIKFINEAEDITEESRDLKTRAIDALLAAKSPTRVTATAELLKTQGQPEIRRHIVHLLSTATLERESALALADTLSNIRSRDAVLIPISGS